MGSNPKRMEVITNARLHVVNGSNYTIQCPEYHGIKFETPKQKEKFRRTETEKMLGNLLKDATDEKMGDLQFETVMLPEGITELPPGWKPDPFVYPPKIVSEQPASFDLEDVVPFVSRKPRFK